MAESFRFKFHTLLAERVRWVQYPRPQYMPAQEIKAPRRPLLRFRYAMPIWQRIAFVVLGASGVLAGLFAVCVGGFVAYCLAAAIILS